MSTHRSETDLYMASGSTKSSSVTSLPQLAMAGSTEVALNPLNPQSNSKYASSVTSLSEHRRGSIHQSGLPESGISQQALRDSILGWFKKKYLESDAHKMRQILDDFYPTFGYFTMILYKIY